MSDYAPRLKDVQSKIKALDEQRDALHTERAKLIREAKNAGMNNREVANALGVYETHVYRIQKSGGES